MQMELDADTIYDMNHFFEFPLTERQELLHSLLQSLIPVLKAIDETNVHHAHVRITAKFCEASAKDIYCRYEVEHANDSIFKRYLNYHTNFGVKELFTEADTHTAIASRCAEAIRAFTAATAIANDSKLCKAFDAYPSDKPKRVTMETRRGHTQPHAYVITGMFYLTVGTDLELLTAGMRLCEPHYRKLGAAIRRKAEVLNIYANALAYADALQAGLTLRKIPYTDASAALYDDAAAYSEHIASAKPGVGLRFVDESYPCRRA